MLDFVDTSSLSENTAKELNDILANPPQTKETKVICIYNQKGGVAKTTSTVNICNCLANLGYKVLLLDTDGQGSASYMLNVDIDDDDIPCLGSILYNYVFHGSEIKFSDIQDAILTPHYYKNIRRKDTIGWKEEAINYGFDLLPSAGIWLSTCEMAFCSDKTFIHRQPNTGRALFKYVVDMIQNRMDYDFIILDTNPNLGIWSVNALTASEYLIIPTPMDYICTSGVQTVVRRVDEIKKYVKSFKNLGVLPTLYNPKRLIDMEIRNDTSSLGSNLTPILPMFEVAIPENVNLSKKVVKQGRILTLEKGPIRNAYYLATLEMLKYIFEEDDYGNK